MSNFLARAGPDTGLPTAIEALVAVLFYAGPLLFAGFAIWAWRRDRPGWSIGALGLLAASIYTEAAFLDLACSPGDDGCEWIESRLSLAGAAAAVAAVAAAALALDRPRVAAALAALGTALGLFVTLGYLVAVV